MATYTVEQAREKWEKAGKVWSPDVEASLRGRGIIEQSAAPVRPERSFGDQMKMAVQSLAQYVPGGYGYDPQERIETGTSSGDLYIDSALKASTLGMLNLDRLGGGEAGPVTNKAQLAMSALGTGTGMIGPLRAITPAASMAATKLVPSVAAPFTNLAAREAVARTLFGSGLALGGYEALMPGSPAERLERAGQGFQSGVALAGVPAAVGASNPVARKAVEFGTMYGLGAAQGMPADENLIQSVAMMLPAEALHAGQTAGGAKKAAKPAKRTPEQVAAEIEALEARLTNERAPMQAEISARVAPFREAQANAQGLQTPATPAEYNRLAGPETLPPRGNAPEVDAAARERAQAVQAETLARERDDYEAKKAFEADFRQRMEAERQRRLAEEAAVPPLERPLQPEIKWSPNPDQYSRTEARIAAMRARQAAAQQPAPGQPLTRTPAQMEIPENRTILLRPDGTVEPAPQRPPMDVGTGTPPEKPVFTGPVVEGEAIPGNMAESAQRYAYESTMRDAAERRAAAAAQQPAAEASPVKETRGQRRARLQAEASQVNAEAARRMGTDLTLGMGGGQQVFEAVGRALAKPMREAAAEIKDAPRRLRNIGEAAKTNWDAAREQLQLDVNENPVSVPFSRANRGEQTYEQAVNDVVSMPRRVRKLTDLR
ncbi:MAG: hypothetical protein ACH37Z_19350, partial [Anaerolineae bacterium]